MSEDLESSRFSTYDYENTIGKLEDERACIQKKTFTKWVNNHLSKCDKSIDDLFAGFEDGHNLIALVETLTNIVMLKSSGKTRFHALQNITACLELLQGSGVKLVNIRSEDIHEGSPKLTLGLIWTLILHYELSFIQQHMTELGNNNNEHDDHSFMEASASYDGDFNDKENVNAEEKVRSFKAVQSAGANFTVKSALLNWVRQFTEKWDGVTVTNFASHWCNGKAFCAIMSAHDSIGLPSDEWNNSYVSNKERLEMAFELASKKFGVPRLLDAEDVDCAEPDEKSIMTYLSTLYNSLTKICSKDEINQETDENEIQKVEEENRKALEEEKKLKELEDQQKQALDEEKRIALEKEQALKEMEERQKKALEEEQRIILEKEQALKEMEDRQQKALEEEKRLALEEEKRLALEEEKRLALEEEKKLALEEEKKLALEKERREMEEREKKTLEEAKRIALKKEQERQEMEEREKKALEDAKRIAFEKEQERREMEEREKKALEEAKRIAFEKEQERREMEEREKKALEEAKRIAMEKEQERQEMEEREKKALEEAKRIAMEKEQTLKEMEERRQQAFKKMKERQKKALEEKKRLAFEKEQALKEIKELQIKALEEELKLKEAIEERRLAIEKEKALEEELRLQKAIEEKRLALENEKALREFEEHEKRVLEEEQKRKEAIEERRLAIEKEKALEEELKLQKAIEEKRLALENEKALREFEEHEKRVLEEEQKRKALDDERKLREYMDEMKRLENFSFEEWRDRYIDFNNHAKARFTDIFRNIADYGPENFPRCVFVKPILESNFPTSVLEMEKVADEFDKGDGMINAKEFLTAMRVDPSKRHLHKTDQERIVYEIGRQSNRCTCSHRFPIEHVGENREFVSYKFGNSTSVTRMVRILQSTIMVRVGGGWEQLDSFLSKHDPCRATGKLNNEIYNLNGNIRMENFGQRRQPSFNNVAENKLTQNQSSVRMNNFSSSRNGSYKSTPTTSMPPSSTNSKTNTANNSKPTTPVMSSRTHSNSRIPVFSKKNEPNDN
uniref:Calponin-homology (CH) domain-containing protein n=1 Tax=Rhabditophanes sp. KR3021 TaxID=114890 RepID=A0AC35TM94_9BILA